MEESDFDSMDREHLDRIFDEDKDECLECLKKISKEESDLFNGYCEECNLELTSQN